MRVVQSRGKFCHILFKHVEFFMCTVIALKFNKIILRDGVNGRWRQKFFKFFHRFNSLFVFKIAPRLLNMWNENTPRWEFAEGMNEKFVITEISRPKCVSKKPSSSSSFMHSHWKFCVNKMLDSGTETSPMFVVKLYQSGRLKTDKNDNVNPSDIILRHIRSEGKTFQSAARPEKNS